MTNEIDTNDDTFRNAFNALSRAAIGHMDGGAYFSDLISDAVSITKMTDSDTRFVVVRKMGTHFFECFGRAKAFCNKNAQDHNFLCLQVTRTKYRILVEPRPVS